jgi:hypothetical protein
MILGFLEHSGNDWPAIITALGVLVTAIFSGIAALYSVITKRDVKESEQKLVAHVVEVNKDIKDVAVAANGMREAQVDMARKLGQAVGEKKGREDLKAEQQSDKDAAAKTEANKPQESS